MIPTFFIAVFLITVFNSPFAHGCSCNGVTVTRESAEYGQNWEEGECLTQDQTAEGLQFFCYVDQDGNCPDLVKIEDNVSYGKSYIACRQKDYLGNNPEGESLCPKIKPSKDFVCSSNIDTCKYGRECCNGRCGPSIVYECEKNAVKPNAFFTYRCSGEQIYSIGARKKRSTSGCPDSCRIESCEEIRYDKTSFTLRCKCENGDCRICYTPTDWETKICGHPDYPISCPQTESSTADKSCFQEVVDENESFLIMRLCGRTDVICFKNSRGKTLWDGCKYVCTNNPF